MSEEIELQDSLEPDQELDLEQPEEVSEQAEVDTEALRQQIADLEAKNKQLYARLKKPKVEKPLNSISIDEDVTQTVRELKLSEDKRTFGYEHNLSPEEVNAIYKINPKPTKETLEDPFVKGGLKAIRSKQSVENATPSTSRRSQSVDGKTWAEMSKEERQKNYATVIAKSVGR